MSVIKALVSAAQSVADSYQRIAEAAERQQDSVTRSHEAAYGNAPPCAERYLVEVPRVDGSWGVLVERSRWVAPTLESTDLVGQLDAIATLGAWNPVLIASYHAAALVARVNHGRVVRVADYLNREA